MLDAIDFNCRIRKEVTLHPSIHLFPNVIVGEPSAVILLNCES
jgi:hypothetical protein